MMQLQQPFSNPMQFGMGMMPDPSSGMTMLGWIRGMQAMQQMMQQAQNPEGMLQNLQLFKPAGSQSSGSGQVPQPASALATGGAAMQASALSSGQVAEPSTSAIAQVAQSSASKSGQVVPASETQVAPGQAPTTKTAHVQLELDEDDAVLDQATKVSDALDNKKGESTRTSKSFKQDGNQAKSKGKGKGKGKGKKLGKAGNGKVLKKPSAKAPALGTREYYAALPLKKKLELRPSGCSKCRWSPGCRPCCYVNSK